MIDYKKELNEEQYKAVMHDKGPALLLAGAGTGKTRTLIYRVAHLIESGVRRENRKAVIDKIAACVILQSYLDYIANNNAGEQ